MVTGGFELNTLRAVELFDNLTEEELEMLRPALAIRSLRPGDVVLSEGDEGRHLFVVLDGQVQVTCAGSVSSTELTRLGPGEVFGEMSLVSDAPIAATVTATMESLVLTMEKEAFEGVLMAHPELCFTLLKNAYQRIRDLDAKIVEGT